jgi:putative endonuclease
MSNHLETGMAGEQFAASRLEADGYRILQRNWRYRRAEIDLIAEKDGILVFVEVKTRRSVDFGMPESFVTARKARFMAEAASAFMEEYGHEGELRFDIIAVLMLPEVPVQVSHFIDAFFPDWA